MESRYPIRNHRPPPGDSLSEYPNKIVPFGSRDPFLFGYRDPSVECFVKYLVVVEVARFELVHAAAAETRTTPRTMNGVNL